MTNTTNAAKCPATAKIDVYHPDYVGHYTFKRDVYVETCERYPSADPFRIFDDVTCTKA